MGNFAQNILKDLVNAKKIYQYKLEISKSLNMDFQNILEDVVNELEDAQVLTTPESLKYAGSFCNLGNVKYDEGLFEEALAYYHKAIGFLSDPKYFFNITEISEKIKHIPIFSYDYHEYYRIAYTLYHLGITYDELSHKDIACLIFQESLNYLKLRNEEEIDLLSKIYHDWAISLFEINIEKSIELLEKSLELTKRIGGIQNERVTEILNNSVW